MQPRDELGRELRSLIVWWSLWSLWDLHLLDYSPLFELLGLGIVGVWVGGIRLYEARKTACTQAWTSANLVLEETTTTSRCAPVVVENEEDVTRL